MPRKIKKPTIDWIKFDSWEESEVYVALRDWTLWDLTWIKELNKVKLIDARPKGITLYDKFYAGEYLQRARKYTRDFDIKLWRQLIHLEYKSKWSQSKPDYRLRRFLVLLSWKLNFAELIKVKKDVYEFKKYF